jgi:kynurenine 3-monooxygenase
MRNFYWVMILAMGWALSARAVTGECPVQSLAPARVTILSGDPTGRGSNSYRMAGIIAQRLRDRGIDATVLDLAAIPVDAQRGRRRQTLEAAQRQLIGGTGLIVVTPDHQGEPPGKLTSLLQGLPGTQPLLGKAVAYVGVSEDGDGGRAPADHLSHHNERLGADTFGPRMLISNASQTIAPDGRSLTNPKIDQFLNNNLDGFTRFTNQERSEPAGNPAEPPPRIVIVAGSRRGKESNSLRLANLAAARMRAQGHVDVEVLDLSQVPDPAFSQAVSHTPGAPPPSFDFSGYQAKMEKADGVLFVTPEYNGSYPGVLKGVHRSAPLPAGHVAGKVDFVHRAFRWALRRPHADGSLFDRQPVPRGQRVRSPHAGAVHRSAARYAGPIDRSADLAATRRAGPRLRPVHRPAPRNTRAASRCRPRSLGGCMMRGNSSKRCVIVGGGMAGPTLAMLLARRGYCVTLFEKRSREALAAPGGTTFNLTLTQRGLAAIDALGLTDRVRAISQPLRLRKMHGPGGRTTDFRYGSTEDELLYSVKRAEINLLLMEAAERSPGVTVRYEREFMDYDRDRGEVRVRDLGTGREHLELADFLIGADGLHSRVRGVLHQGRPADLELKYFDWGYIEISVTEAECHSLGLQPDCIHVWPGDSTLFIAIPNRDGSMTGNLMLPLSSWPKTPDQMQGLIGMQFASLVGKLIDLGRHLISRRPRYLSILQTSCWTDADRILLIGDAAHGVFPFYGQGMNSALEDCLWLDRCLANSGEDRARAFALFEKERKIDTHALRELSVDHFHELKNTRRHRFLPSLTRRMTPKYALVAHTTRPYREALDDLRRRKWRARAAAAALVVATLLGVAIGGVRAIAARRRQDAMSPISQTSPLATP